MVRVCVIGAGVVGLSTAWQVTEQIKDASVVVYAEKFASETTSHGAAGIFNPRKSLTNAPNIEKLCADSWEFFNSIVRSNEARNAGISVMDGYELHTEPTPLETKTYRPFVYDFSQINPDRLTFLPDARKIRDAYHITTLLIECRRYLPWTMKRLEQRGVVFKRRFISNLKEVLSEDFEIVFNCAGLGNQQLLGDTKMVPVRGQLIRAHAPWVNQFFMLDDWTYMFPGQDLLIMGGCSQRGNYNLNVSQEDSLSIWERCKQLVPSVGQAVVDHEWVGLRPYRDQVRIEDGGFMENPVSGHQSRIIHNYGYGILQNNMVSFDGLILLAMVPMALVYLWARLVLLLHWLPRRFRSCNQTVTI